MFLAFYNKHHVGDVLLLLNQETNDKVLIETKKNITHIFKADTLETVGYNIFNASHYFDLSEYGHVTLTDTLVNDINHLLVQAQFEPISVDLSPKFVIGHIDSCQPHPDSNHLKVTSVSIGEENPLQIVCGAPNVDQGQLVVVAKIGAVMPDGLIIWEGSLRGVTSQGMICSAKELALPNASNKKGILVLNSGQIGAPFQF